MGTYKWYPSDFAILDSNNPNVNDHTSSTAPDKSSLWMHFERPSALVGKQISTMKLCVKINSEGDLLDASTSEVYLQAFGIRQAWSASEVTYASHPSLNFDSIREHDYYVEDSTFSFGFAHCGFYNSYTDDEAMIDFLDSAEFGISVSSRESYMRGGWNFKSWDYIVGGYYTPAASSANRPYIEVTYKDTPDYVLKNPTASFMASSTFSSDYNAARNGQILAGEKYKLENNIVINPFIYFADNLSISSIRLVYDTSSAFSNPKYLNLTAAGGGTTGTSSSEKYYREYTTKFNSADIGEDILFDTSTPSVSFYLKLEVTYSLGGNLYPFTVFSFATYSLFSFICPTIISMNPTNGAYIQHTQAKSVSVVVGGTLQDTLGSGTSYHQFEPAALRLYYGTSSPSSYIDLVDNIIPANTLGANNYVAKYGIALGNGMSMESPQFSFTTLEPQSTTTNLAPANTTVDGSRTVRLSWNHQISTGTAQKGYKIQYKTTSAGTWTNLVDAPNNSNQYYDLNSVAGGTFYWRVATYNSDSVLGSYSEAMFTVVSASPAPAINNVDASPMFGIGWSATGQLAYEIKLNEELIKADFGAVYEYRHNDFLPDGAYTVAVRVQNQYGLWSEWGVSAFAVNNNPTHYIKLEAHEENGNAVLEWTKNLYRVSDDEQDGSVISGLYYIYRNGKLIHLLNSADANLQFTDYFPELSNSYAIKPMTKSSVLTYGYFASDVADLDIVPACITLTDTSTGEKLELPLSDAQTRETGYRISNQYSEIMLAGNRLPYIEVGIHQTRYYSFRCAFRNDDERRVLLESILAKTVCLVDQFGERIFGMFTECERVRNEFRTAYDITLTETGFDEMKAGVYQ